MDARERTSAGNAYARPELIIYGDVRQLTMTADKGADDDTTKGKKTG